LKALLYVMRDDQWEGKGLAAAELRRLFTREAMLGSAWYAARLEAKRQVDRRLWRRHIDYLDRFLKKSSYADEAARLGIAGRLASARKMYDDVESTGYLERLRGTLGAEPIGDYLKG
jgi:hypothetical protein